MSVFDWCIHGDCDNCVGKVRDFWFEKRRKGKRQIEVLVYANEDRLCEHSCHRRVVGSETTKPLKRKK